LANRLAKRPGATRATGVTSGEDSATE
jgi:hypothetical protein